MPPLRPGAQARALPGSAATVTETQWRHFILGIRALQIESVFAGTYKVQGGLVVWTPSGQHPGELSEPSIQRVANGQHCDIFRQPRSRAPNRAFSYEARVRMRKIE